MAQVVKVQVVDLAGFNCTRNIVLTLAALYGKIFPLLGTQSFDPRHESTTEISGMARKCFFNQPHRVGTRWQKLLVTSAEARADRCPFLTRMFRSRTMIVRLARSKSALFRFVISPSRMHDAIAKSTRSHIAFRHATCSRTLSAWLARLQWAYDPAPRAHFCAASFVSNTFESEICSRFPKVSPRLIRTNARQRWLGGFTVAGYRGHALA